MKMKELEPKYERLKVFFDKDTLIFLEVPRFMKYDFAMATYPEREIIFSKDLDDEKCTEIIMENDQQFRKRTNRNNFLG